MGGGRRKGKGRKLESVGKVGGKEESKVGFGFAFGLGSEV